ncbi:ABC transporter permease [Oceanobacillus piezotolerans]|uniref:ABC transporter permease n=2 Tax=Oceanobacillus piezotolerans TaxID=2448030 RepID=A0A498D568_9BACI|nr:ABC transporter permease [Oceanobacillus piezotolerans]
MEKKKLVNDKIPRKKKKRHKVWNIETLITISTFTFILLAWFVLTELEFVSSLIMPSPATVLQSFQEVITTGYKGNSLWVHILDSMTRLLTGYFLAAVLGILLGLASGYNRKIRAVFDPIVEFYQSLPPLAYYTVLIIWFGIGDLSKVVLLFLAAFAPMFIASMSGVKNVKTEYIQGAYNLGANKWQTFFYIIFPASLPYIFTGLRTSMVASYGTLVAAEMVAGVSGLGWMVIDASRFMRSDIIFMGLIVMGIISIILDRLLRFAEGKIVPWKGKD